MKTSIFTHERLFRAWHDCRRNKRNRPDALLFELNAEENLLELARELQEKSYHPSPYSRFASRKPKLREIFAADFRDRIVHHLLVSYLEPFWEPVFIHDSFASRREKGIHLALQRVRSFTRKATRNNTRPAHYLQLDIRNFFMRIDQDILYSLIRTRCPNPEMARLAGVIVFHDPTRNHIPKSSRRIMNRIPKAKTLVGTEKDRGLPIGNLTSQFFANIYLDGLDQFIKHRLKCRYYARYVDDLVLIHESRDQLAQWHEKIGEWLAQERRLDLNERRTRKQPVSNGIDFLGYIIRPRYVLCRNRVTGNCRDRLRELERRMIIRKKDRITVRYDPETVTALHDCLNSYFAHFDHANAFRLKQSLFRRFPFIHHYAALTEKGLQRQHLPPSSSVLKRQYRYFDRVYEDYLLFFQVGCFYEFYGIRAATAVKKLRLKWIVGKYGFRRRCGIGIRALDRYVCQGLNSGWPVAIVVRPGIERQG